jgi:hypothetical protein
MGTRMGRLALIGARDEAAKRLNVIESEIRRILDNFPELRRRQPIQSRSDLVPRRRRPTAAATRVPTRMLH